MALTVVNPLATNGGSVTLGSVPAAAAPGTSSVGTLLPSTPSSSSASLTGLPAAQADNYAGFSGGGSGGAAPTSTTSTTSNNTSSTPAATSPTAAQIAQQQAQTNYNNENSAVNSEVGSGITTQGGDYNQSILDLINANTGAQSKINADAVQNELAKDQGMQGVTDMVGNGIQGGGVQIDDAGGGTSSAGQQLAQDYGIVGRQAASQVGNQYAQGENTVNSEQDIQNGDEATQVGDEQQKKADAINSIIQGATQSLTMLDSYASEAGISDMPNILAQQAAIKAQATAALSAYDSELSGIQIAPTTQAANQAKAQGLFAAGTAPAQAFNYTTTAPATFANTGPSPSALPIYIAPATKNNDTTGV